MDKFIYLDTNILSELAKQPSWWEKFSTYLKANNLTLAVSGAQLVELHDAPSLHKGLVELLWLVNTKVLKNWDEVVYDRLEQGRLFGELDAAMLPYTLSESSEINAKDNFLQGLSADNMKGARTAQLRDAAKMREMILERKSNFRPNSEGKYKPSQATKYAKTITRQWLSGTDATLKKLYKDYGNRIDHFRSIEIYAYFCFYKYYIAGHDTKKASDFGDLFHLFYLSSASIAVLERGMAEILKQVQKNHDVLAELQIETIDLLRNEILK